MRSAVNDEEEMPECAWCGDLILVDGIHYDPDDPDEPEADYCSIACWLSAQ